MRLAERLWAARERGDTVWVARCGGAEIPVKAILAGVGLRAQLGGSSVADGAAYVAASDTPALGLALGAFKAAQLLSSRGFENAFRDFTAVDLETTGNDIHRAEIVEMAAVRVRDGRITHEFRSYVKPRVPIEPGARRTHGLSEVHVEMAPYFEEIWPHFRAFCGNDVLVAHNGYQFDFPILRRMAVTLGGAELSTYDTLPLARELVPASRKLSDLARAYGIDAGQSHHALDDVRTLARVFLALSEARIARARKTALVNLLDQLGLALALSDQAALCTEAQLLRQLARACALGRYSACLELYDMERSQCGDDLLPTREQALERLGGEELMRRIRADKTADQRYPGAMARLRRLLDECADGPLDRQLETFLARAVLSSKSDGVERERERVNLLTLHSTKGLEFSRVYVVGAEDAQLIGGTPSKPPSKQEIEEARRLLYVGMTRAKDRLVLTRVDTRAGRPTGGNQFLDEMGLTPRAP